MSIGVAYACKFGGGWKREDRESRGKNPQKGRKGAREEKAGRAGGRTRKRAAKGPGKRRPGARDDGVIIVMAYGNHCDNRV